MMVTNITCRSFGIAALMASIALAGSASAQPKAEPATQATQFFDKGTAFYKQGRWAEAEVEFQKAWDLRKSFDVAANLGDCELEIGQNREAAEHLAYAVREFPLTGKPALRERLQQRFADARSRVGALSIRVNVPGAEIVIDGRAIGVAPLDGEVFVEPGAHALEARLGEYEAARANVDVTRGASKQVALTLVKSGTPGGGGGPSTAVIIGGAAVTGVALVTGIVLAAVASGKASDADAKLKTLPRSADACQTHASTCSAIDSARGTRDALSNASMGMFIGAGAVGLATLGYALFTPKAKPRATGVRVLPAIGAGQGGVAIMGTW